LTLFFRASIDYRLRAGSKILQIKAKDRDLGENARISYSILASDFSKFFKIDKSNGQITTSDFQLPIDRKSIDFFVKAKDSGIPSLETTVQVSIDFSDQHETSTYSDLNITFITVPGNQAKIPEDTKVGSIIAIVKPVDQTQKFANISLVQDGDGHFKFTTGSNDQLYLTLKHELDRETCDNFSLEIKYLQLIDNNNNQWQSINVSIEILDINDNAPEFDKEIYEANIHENAAHASSVIKIHAHDKDFGLNGKIRYSIDNRNHAKSTDNNWLEIDPETGLVSTIGSKIAQMENLGPNCEENSKLEYSIRATDLGLPQKFSTTKLILHIIGVNDHIPIFDKSIYNVTIREDLGIGTCFLQVFSYNFVICNYVQHKVCFLHNYSKTW